jgi:mannose-6-phosphate isomerase-like protein (cupin superfamily)
MEAVREKVAGEGYAIAHLDGIGEGPGFRKVRRALDVTAFGVNAIVLPAGYASGFHFHDEQEETYVILSGTGEMEFGDGKRFGIGPGVIARVDAPTTRRVHNTGDDELVYICFGGKDGYVGRDGRMPEGSERVEGGPPGATGGGFGQS